MQVCLKNDERQKHGVVSSVLLSLLVSLLGAANVSDEIMRQAEGFVAQDMGMLALLGRGLLPIYVQGEEKEAASGVEAFLTAGNVSLPCDKMREARLCCCWYSRPFIPER